ncbi:sugar kinase [Streptomyces sp. PLAI1-29]|uniref:Sugar kinase n=2 Tax=Streptomyces zingiberis TaxID=2053010 RepID=A0ABX1BYQ7_9ACTN|nr:sugar kinase [Streptomyces zingiberis]
MVMFRPDGAGPLAGQSAVRLSVGGAESNVACALVGLGHRAAWLGRVGDDPFGHRVLADLAGRGVDVSGAVTDPERPTGIYFKDPGSGSTRTHYYRAGSAATALGPELARLPAVRGARVVHLSGISAALSDTCAALLDALTVRRAAGRDPGPLISFDVNHRPALWRGGTAEAAERLLIPARAADLVFVGRDEAEALWGTARPEEVAALLGPHPVVVVKDAEHGATSWTASPSRTGRTASPSGTARVAELTGTARTAEPPEASGASGASGPDRVRTFVPALPTDVVEPVGAGDAFAAGYLAGLLEGRDERARLRLGHLAARAALRTADDVPAMPARAETDPMLALTETAWPG